MDSSQAVKVAVIIPTLNGAVDALCQALRLQTWPPDEIQIVRNVRPNGRARNQGVSETSAEVIVFIDDDALPAQANLIEALVLPLLQDKSVGVSGAARVLPRSAGWFQTQVAREIPRTVNEVPARSLETNPPLEGYGHSQITTTCCALRREVYLAAGGFSNFLISGVDTDLFYRIRQLGYRFIMVPDVSVEHPASANLRSLLRKFRWYGIGYAQEAQRRPEQKIGPSLPGRIQRIAFLALATLWLIPNIFILYSFGYPYWHFGFRPLKALSTYAVAWGYVRGWQKGIFEENNSPVQAVSYPIDG